MTQQLHFTKSWQYQGCRQLQGGLGELSHTRGKLYIMCLVRHSDKSRPKPPRYLSSWQVKHTVGILERSILSCPFLKPWLKTTLSKLNHLFVTDWNSEILAEFKVNDNTTIEYNRSGGLIAATGQDEIQRKLHGCLLDKGKGECQTWRWRQNDIDYITSSWLLSLLSSDISPCTLPLPFWYLAYDIDAETERLHTLELQQTTII